MERKHTNNMTEKEIVYRLFSEFVDDVVEGCLDNMVDLMGESFSCKLIILACESKMEYEEQRRIRFIRGEDNKFFYNLASDNWKAYRTIIYDLYVKEDK